MMMIKSLPLLALSLVFTTTAVLAAPSNISADVLQQNAINAQNLNLQFESVKPEDQCTPGETACIEGTILSTCSKDGKFETGQRCSQGQQCVALPSVTGNGTNVLCTSERTAISVFQALGFNSLTPEEGSANNSTGDANVNNAGNDNNNEDGPVTVTATVVVSVSVAANGQATTIAESTVTVSPEEASSLVSSLATATSSDSTATATSVASVANGESTTSTSAASEASNTSSVAVAAAPAPTTTESATTTAAVVATPPAAVSPVAVEGDGAIGAIQSTSVPAPSSSPAVVAAAAGAAPTPEAANAPEPVADSNAISGISVTSVPMPAGVNAVVPSAAPAAGGAGGYGY